MSHSQHSSQNIQQRRQHAINTTNSRYNMMSSGNNNINNNFNSNYNDNNSTLDEDQSVTSDTISEISRADFNDKNFYDHNNDTVIKASIKNPSILIGWQVNVKNRGVGVIIDMIKAFGRSTKFKIQFANNRIEHLSLKRSDTKGKIPFSMITKVST